MADLFQIIPYKVRSAGTDVPPEEVQAAINSLAQQTTVALNSVASDPTGPAGGDLSGTYPNPTVTSSHISSGTISGVVITGSTLNSTPIGQSSPNSGAFTTATAGSLFASGGAVPAVTATGTQVYNSPNPTVQFIDSIRSANNKNAFVTWGSTVLAFGFANDAFTGFTNALSITGGQASGISGITSSSGTGAWAHTGGFSATGGINSTNVGATTPGTGAFTSLTSTSGGINGTVGATTPNTGAFTTLSASSGLNSTAVGNTTPSTGAFTTLTATTPVGVASGGTGRNTLTVHGVLIGEAAAAINQTAAGTTGQMLLGVTGADPAFGNNPTITGGTVDNAVIGGTTKAAGSFTTVVATGTITPSSTNGIVGTTTNDNAQTGSVGEFVTATGTGVSVTNSTIANIASISLTAGDWEVTGNIAFIPTGSTATGAVVAWVSSTSATLPATGLYSILQSTTFTANAMQTQIAPVQRFSLSGTTTVFLSGQINFTGGTATATGIIRARRVR